MIGSSLKQPSTLWISTKLIIWKESKSWINVRRTIWKPKETILGNKTFLFLARNQSFIQKVTDVLTHPRGSIQLFHPVGKFWIFKCIIVLNVYKTIPVSCFQICPIVLDIIAKNSVHSVKYCVKQTPFCLLIVRHTHRFFIFSQCIEIQFEGKANRINDILVELKFRSYSSKISEKYLRTLKCIQNAVKQRNTFPEFSSRVLITGIKWSSGLQELQEPSIDAHNQHC